MPKKIFFTDLDDTLLNRKKEISKANRDAINAVLEKGHAVTITTGRAYGPARQQAEKLGITGENCYMICYNGSLIYDFSKDKIVYQTGLTPEIVRLAFREAIAFGIPVQTYSQQEVIAELDTPVLREYCRIQNVPWRIVENAADYLVSIGEPNPPKILIVDYRHDENVNEFRRRITPLLEGKADIFLSHSDMMEIVPVGVNKGAAIHILCDYLGLSIEATVSAGDAENDLEMIQEAHIGCAMCNGEPGVLTAADYITQNDCDHDGVAEILEKFVLGDAMP